MAVVFISPKQRQKTFFVVITAGVAVFLLFVMMAVFFSKPKETPQTMVFNKPKVSIDLKIFDLEQFKFLVPFEKMELQFSYKATDGENKLVEGFISAPSKEEAGQILIDMGYMVKELKELEIGRENPFTPYFQTNSNPPK